MWVGRAFYLAIQQDKAHKRKKGGPFQDRGPLHNFLSPELTLGIPPCKTPRHQAFRKAWWFWLFSWTQKVGGWKMDSSFGTKIWKPKPGYWDFWSPKGVLSHRDSSFWFVESTIYEVRHLIFAWYFARYHEYIIFFLKTTSWDWWYYSHLIRKTHLRFKSRRS